MKHVTKGTTGTIKPGYIYVLTHPSDPKLYKVGKTILDPLKRMSQHNSDYKKYAGQVVQETGQKWEMKTFIEVPDPYRQNLLFGEQHHCQTYYFWVELKSKKWNGNGWRWA